MNDCQNTTNDQKTIEDLKSQIAELKKQLSRCRLHALNGHDDMVRQNWIYNDIFDNIFVAISIFNSELQLSRYNNKFSKMFGITSEAEVKGKNFFSHQISEEMRQQVAQNDVTEFRLDFDLDHTHYHSSRRGVINLHQKLMKLYDVNGVVYGYVNMSIEDTDRLVAVNKVHEFEKFFSFISDFAKIGYTKVNLYNDTGYAIKQWYKNLGESEHTPLGHIIGVYRNVHPDDRKKLTDCLQKIRNGELTYYHLELRVHNAADRTRWSWLRKYGVVTEYAPQKQVIEIISVNYDITELKNTAEALRKARDKAETTDKLKSAFLANMSHEIRTPLNAIVGFSNLLCESDSSADKERFREIIQDNSNILLQLITDILDLSKMESGSIEYNFKRVDVNDLCNSLLMTLQRRANPGVEMLFDSHLQDCHIVSDDARLYQLHANFLTNAIKHTTTGNIRLGYTIEGGNISFHVSDTGCGIPKQQLRKIFDRFVKLDKFLPGTGLGLSICKNIAKGLGGTISVESQEGIGSTFHFTMPYGKRS